VRAPALAKPPDPPRWVRYFLPETTDAATFSVNGVTIHIAGVKPPAPGDTCASADGGQPWPCGQTALYAFRRFLHGRAVECYFPYTSGVSDVIAPCRVGDTDLGLWLLAQGWARPDNLATDAYAAASGAARCDRLGLWREEAQPAGCPAAPAASN
jgi:endonuclease YncB( thermonuclease family)